MEREGREKIKRDEWRDKGSGKALSNFPTLLRALGVPGLRGPLALFALPWYSSPSPVCLYHSGLWPGLAGIGRSCLGNAPLLGTSI